MKFYLASSFKLIDKVEAAAQIIEGWGHSITEKWWKRPYQVEGLGVVETADLKEIYDKLTPEEFYAKPETRMSFDKDYLGILNADVFLFVADDKPRKYNGANVELGIALAESKFCACIGVLEKSVLYCTVKRFKAVEEVLDYLGVEFKK